MTADNAQRQTQPDASGIDLRFRLHKEQGVIKIYGALDSTTTVELLEDMRAADMTLDLSGLRSASWGGIVKFYRYLLGFGASLRLRGIPSHLYRSLRLLVDKSDPISIEEAEIEVFDPLDAKKPLEKKKQPIQDLEKLAVAQGPILTVAPGKQVLGIAEYVCPRYFQSRGAPAPEFTNPWCKGNPSESLFWFNLGHVLTNTFILGADLLESARRNLGASLADLTILFKALAESEKALSATGRQLDDQRVMRELTSLNQQILTFNQVVDKIEGHCTLALKELQIASWSQSANNPDTILKALHDLVFAANSQALQPPEVASLLSHIDLHAEKNIGSELLTKLKPCTDKGQLTKVRDSFSIMSMDDDLEHADELVLDVELELAALKEHLRLARIHVAAVKAGQTLLRRWQSDVQYIKACLNGVKAQSTSWSELRDGLFSQWRARDMTPEEIKVYSFYFPDALYLGELIVDDNASAISDPTAEGIDLDALLDADFKIDNAD
jgi:hypothetical protein